LTFGTRLLDALQKDPTHALCAKRLQIDLKQVTYIPNAVKPKINHGGNV
jgi:hypothetical protein